MRANVHRMLRLAGLNAALLVAGLALTATVLEVRLRLTVPFMATHTPSRFVSGVGLLRVPGAEIRYTNGLDFWTVSRTNRWGFLDREPAGPDRAAPGCHVAVLGDSFVEAKEVSIADKMHVRFEALAAGRLPHLEVTASAFGFGGTGQINQLPYYDEYARRLRPRLVVLVFVENDFADNSALLDTFSLRKQVDPDHLPFLYAERRADGRIALRPPDPDWEAHIRPLSPASTVMARVLGASWLAQWLAAKRNALFPAEVEAGEHLAALRRRAGGERLRGWQPAPGGVDRTFAEEALPPAFEDALEFTAFALDRFKARAERDGAALVILASHRMRIAGDRVFDRLRVMAGTRGIPVIDQADYILRQGVRLEDAQWRHAPHWNVDGHRWAAEALLEWLRDNQEVCGGPAIAPGQPHRGISRPVSPPDAARIGARPASMGRNLEPIDVSPPDAARVDARPASMSRNLEPIDVSAPAAARPGAREPKPPAADSVAFRIHARATAAFPTGFAP